jgi:localization factor PodJL
VAFFAIGLVMLSGCVDAVRKEISLSMADQSYYRNQDYAAAVARYREAANFGSAEAQYKLALMLEKGQGVPRDPAAAVHWMRQSAALNHLPAQHRLGMWYLAGQSGLTKDPLQAAGYTRTAAEAGYGPAMFTLGLLYATGEGVPFEPATATRWFLAAKAQGELVPDEFLNPGNFKTPTRKLSTGTIEPARAGAKMTPQVVREVQSGLKRLGYNPGPVDGMFGRKTAQAIREYQQDRGLTIDGNITDEFLKRFRRDLN